MVEDDISERLESIEISYIYHSTGGDTRQENIVNIHHITQVTAECYTHILVIIPPLLRQLWGDKFHQDISLSGGQTGLNYENYYIN